MLWCELCSAWLLSSSRPSFLSGRIQSFCPSVHSDTQHLSGISGCWEIQIKMLAGGQGISMRTTSWLLGPNMVKAPQTLVHSECPNSNLLSQYHTSLLFTSIKKKDFFAEYRLKIKRKERRKLGFHDIFPYFFKGTWNDLLYFD